MSSVQEVILPNMNWNSLQKKQADMHRITALAYCDSKNTGKQLSPSTIP